VSFGGNIIDFNGINILSKLPSLHPSFDFINGANSLVKLLGEFLHEPVDISFDLIQSVFFLLMRVHLCNFFFFYVTLYVVIVAVNSLVNNDDQCKAVSDSLEL